MATPIVKVHRPFGAAYSGLFLVRWAMPIVSICRPFGASQCGGFFKHGLQLNHALNKHALYLKFSFIDYCFLSVLSFITREEQHVKPRIYTRKSKNLFTSLKLFPEYEIIFPL